jgi:hypothetical protein
MILNIEYIYNLLYRFIFGGGDATFSNIQDILMRALIDVWTAVAILGIALSVLFGVGIAYILSESKVLAAQVEAQLEALFLAKTQAAQTGSGEDRRWEHVLALVASGNPSDWRAAILEADIMLSELTERMLLPGFSVGDRLKMATRDRFQTLNDAWEAHKVRNEVAHSGSQFLLTQREARRAIALYGNVFREHGMIA